MEGQAVGMNEGQAGPAWQIAVRLPEELRRGLESEATARGVTKAEVIRRALRFWLLGEETPA